MLTTETFNLSAAVRREILFHPQVESLRQLRESVLQEELRSRGINANVVQPGLYEIYTEWRGGDIQNLDEAYG